MAAFAPDLGDDGPPFRWDEERRFAMRAELDAAFFHLYGIERDDVDYIMETFPIVKRKDVAALRLVPHQGTDPGRLRRDGRGHADRRAVPDDPRSATRTWASPCLTSRSDGVSCSRPPWRSCATRGPGCRKPQVLDEVRRRIVLTPAELSAGTGRVVALRDRARISQVGDAATIGWTTKIGGWSITDAGIEALETYPGADEPVVGTEPPLPRDRSAA